MPAKPDDDETDEALTPLLTEVAKIPPRRVPHAPPAPPAAPAPAPPTEEVPRQRE